MDVHHRLWKRYGKLVEESPTAMVTAPVFCKFNLKSTHVAAANAPRGAGMVEATTCMGRPRNSRGEPKQRKVSLTREPGGLVSCGKAPRKTVRRTIQFAEESRNR